MNNGVETFFNMFFFLVLIIAFIAPYVKNKSNRCFNKSVDYKIYGKTKNGKDVIIVRKKKMFCQWEKIDA